MNFKSYRNLNKNERFSSSKQILKSFYSDFETLNLKFLFGLTRAFSFDSRCSNRPKIKGTVVSSISYYRDRKIYFSLFPVSINDYPDTAIDEFNNKVLITIKQWIESQINKPDTALLGVEELIVEWNGKEHIFHQIKYL